MTEKKGWLVKVLLFVVGIVMVSTLKLQATHLRAGQIRVERIGCSSLQVKVTVTVYTDTGCGGGCVLFGGPQDVLDFGDGAVVLVPETANTPYPGAVNVGIASYTTTHTYPGPGRYIVSYLEPNRNGGVLNMNNSIGTTFYLETQIDLSVGCSNSATLATAPIDEACSGVLFSHNPGASDPDGDSLSYELVVPFRDRNAPVDNYRDPNNAGFYGGLDYNVSNETGDGPPTFAIDPIDGTLTWDAPGQAGEYNVAFIVKEWRKINGQWIDIGFVRRDMQIIVVADCTNERPKLIVPADTCVVAGAILNKTILGTDPENHVVKMEAFSEILNPSFDARATVTPFPAVFRPSNPPAKLVFNWNTACSHVKELSYQVVFKITDDPPQGPSLATFETWKIKVVGPAPVLQPATVNLAKRYVDLTWDSYACQNAELMQIWRRVDETNFTPSNCETGMPEALGYTLITTVPISNSTYKDTNGGKGLAVGAKYCYRLVAQFPLPLGGESYVSDEVCIDPILADAPVITHVTVDKTSATNGEITVRWTPPFDIDPVQFPGPKEYQLQRLSGTGFINENSTPIAGTSFTSTGLNTLDRQYFYRVVLYSGTASNPALQPIDTSALASSVWLDLDPAKKQIDLSWRAAVPWSIQLQDFPLHDVFRGPEGSVESDLVFIESVNVIQDGLTYLDLGKLAPGDSLNRNFTYCYRVLTRGGYGNPAITEPLINYSQINCAQPTDEEPPCTPSIEPFVNTCEEFGIDYGCDATNFTNTVRWSVPCKEDIRSYNLYVASSEDGTYVLLASNIVDTVYEDKNLSSLARCYKVAAVDRSNNESELSEAICNDNCPYYELPNVFSPGNADGKNCNELFRAFGAPLNLGENPDCPEVDVERSRCARFIQKVDFTVYNRWGGKVYHYVGQQGDENNNIYINWNGRDENGRELATAVYYYIAEITQDVVDPSERVKIVKGWVHLVR
jgi:hypothetical protein